MEKNYKYAIMAFGHVYADNLTLQQAKDFYMAVSESKFLHIKKYEVI